MLVHHSLHHLTSCIVIHKYIKNLLPHQVYYTCPTAPGEYLRARGRGRGSGRPAEFHKRLVLEGEEAPQDDDEDDEEALERQQRYSRRQLGTNADRYVEPEPELGPDGRAEVDLAVFLEKQRISDVPTPWVPPEVDEDDVDHSLAHMLPRSGAVPSKKGKVEQIEWDDKLDELSREKAAAEAVWDLKTRFRAKSERMRSKPVRDIASERKTVSYVDAPALPIAEGEATQPKDPMKEMEDFLDDLLT
ncbi:hypothetical protein BD779DRAFT_1612127 [Infundibulicybe gibba]|nr:hypothetical protein BD779DRAFT_1612127 [Infundibulicybe gibba]